MLTTRQAEQLQKKAINELNDRFDRKLVETKSGKKYWAEPNFQETNFNGARPDGFELTDNYHVIYRVHNPFWWTKQYIVTYQIISI